MASEEKLEFELDGETFGGWKGELLPDWLQRHLAPYTAAVRANRLAKLLVALEAARPSPSVGVGELREAEIAVIEAARDLVMKPGGLVNRGVDRGLVVVEKADKSDPHYRLCTAFERLAALSSIPVGGPPTLPDGAE